MLLEFVVGSWLNCYEGYPLDTLVFLQLKNQHFLEFQFDQDRGTMRKPSRADVASSLNIIIYLIFEFMKAAVNETRKQRKLISLTLEWATVAAYF